MGPSATMLPGHGRMNHGLRHPPSTDCSLPTVPEDGVLEFQTKPTSPPWPKKVVIRPKTTAIYKTAYNPATRRLVQDRTGNAERCRTVPVVFRYHGGVDTSNCVAISLLETKSRIRITSSTKYEDLYQSLLREAKEYVPLVVKGDDLAGTLLLTCNDEDRRIDRENWIQESKQVFDVEDVEIKFNLPLIPRVGREGPESTQGLMPRICPEIGTRIINAIMTIGLCGRSVHHDAEDDTETSANARQFELIDDYPRTYSTFPSRGRYSRDLIIP